MEEVSETCSSPHTRHYRSKKLLFVIAAILVQELIKRCKPSSYQRTLDIADSIAGLFFTVFLAFHGFCCGCLTADVNINAVVLLDVAPEKMEVRNELLNIRNPDAVSVLINTDAGPRQMIERCQDLMNAALNAIVKNHF